MSQLPAKVVFRLFLIYATPVSAGHRYIAIQVKILSGAGSPYDVCLPLSLASLVLPDGTTACVAGLSTSSTSCLFRFFFPEPEGR